MRTISCAFFIVNVATSIFAMELNYATAWPSNGHVLPVYADQSHNYFVHNLNDALEKGAPAIVIYSLARQGAPLWYKRSLVTEGATSIMNNAVELGNIAAVDALLCFDPNLVYQPDFRNWTPVEYAKKLGNIYLQHLFSFNNELIAEQSSAARLWKIVENGRKAGIDDNFYLSVSLFHRAAFYGKRKAIKVLLAVNPKLGTQQDFNGYTAYQYALALKNQEIMAMLPQYTPSLSNEEKAQHVVFMLAVASGDEDVVEESLETIKHLEYARSEADYDPLQLAIASFVSSDLIKLLFARKLFKEEGSTSIYHFAVKANNLEAIKTLESVDKSFQKNITKIDQQGFTPAQLARSLGRDFEKIATYLENAPSPKEEPSFFSSLFSSILTLSDSQ